MTHLYNKLWLQTNLGASRVGKSWANLVQGEISDPKHFDITKVAFTPKEYLDIINDIRHKGQVAVMSELGIALSSRRWQSTANILINEILQTTGYLNPIALFDVPDFSYVDSQARKIMDAVTVVTRRKNQPTKMWFYRIFHDRKQGFDYFVHPRAYINGERVILRSIIFKRKPSAQLLKEFVQKEEDYKGKLRKRHRKILTLMEKDAAGVSNNLNKDLDYIKKNTESMKTARGRLSLGLIQAKMEISHMRANQLKQLYEKKYGIKN